MNNHIHPLFATLLAPFAPSDVPSEDATEPEDRDEDRGESTTVGGWPRFHIGKREDDDESHS